MIFIFFIRKIQYGDWGLGIGDWGLGIGDWAQNPKPKNQNPKPQKIIIKIINKKINLFKKKNI